MTFHKLAHFSFNIGNLRGSNPLLTVCDECCCVVEDVPESRGKHAATHPENTDKEQTDD